MNLTCYVHVAPLGRWEAIARELLDRMDAAGLTDALHARHLCWNGPGPIPDWLHLRGGQGRGGVAQVGEWPAAGEVPTLRRLAIDSVLEPEGAVLYLHVKGACHPPGPVDRWRDWLASGVIGRWRECVAALEAGHDAAGNEWYGPDRADAWRATWGLWGCDLAPHFAGNFWWARRDYVARLPHVPMTTRFDAEYRFIGAGSPRVYCPAFAGIDWYASG